MAEIINMPRLSDTMEEGVVAKWLVNIGDKVNEGDILAEIETDKATMEFESFHEGTLLHIGIQEGETAEVDTLLAIIGEEGEDISQLLVPVNNSVQLDLVDQINETESSIEEDKPEINSEIKINNSFQIITMPRLSDTMEEGTVSSWLVNVGDTVQEGDILAEIETDKATMEFESFHEGILLYIGIKVGETAKVDSLLAVIGDADSDFKSAVENFGSEIPQVKNENAESINDLTPELPETPETPEIVETVETLSVNSNSRILASPLAKKIAKEKSIDLKNINGSGDNGRIIKEDVENYTAPKIITVKPNIIKSEPSLENESFEEIENSQMRKAIARRLKESKFSAPHYYLSVEFEMDNAIAFRKQYNSMPDTKISFNDIIVKACAIALKQHPRVNSQWFEDKMRLNNHVHIGVAVGVPDGLVVPVIKFADNKTIPEIGILVKNYAGKARDKKLTPEEMQGSTFTISNLGMFGIQEFTSIINQPNSAILSVGSIIKKPIVRDDKIVIGHTMKLTLACDHRTVDGVTGSLFLETLKGFVENPVTMLV